MADEIDTLSQIGDQITRLQSIVNDGRGKSVTAPQAQPIASAIARAYFTMVGPELAGIDEQLANTIDQTIQELLLLASASRDKGSYSILDDLKTLLFRASVTLMKALGVRRLVLSQTEMAILRKLKELDPVSAESYEQALRDVSEGDRLSWRGTANEMREVLREVMHRLAPDDVVKADPQFAMEQNQTRPTQAQRVRYILKERRSKEGAIAVAEKSLALIEESVAVLARSTYTRSNETTHSGSGVREVRNLKRYLDALLGELLAIS